MNKTTLLCLWLLGACGTPREPSPGELGGPFPHPEGFETTHGEDAEQLSGCFACHPVDPPPVDTAAPADTASSVDTAGDSTPPEGDPRYPACRSCHAAYPHARDFRDEHGATWLEDEYACTRCHGPAGQRDPTSGPTDTCVGCHATFPHPSNQTSAREHGADVVVRGGDTACAGCHEAATCQECHAAYPHGDDWFAGHGDAYAKGSCGGNCHDGADEGAPGEVSCSTCHDEDLP